MSVGFAFWLGALFRDYLRRHGNAKLERRARVAGPVVAEITRSGHRPSTTSGLRARRVYLLWAMPLLVLAVSIALVAVHNYRAPGGAVTEIGWLLAAAFAVAFGVALAGGALLAVGVLGSRRTAATRRLAATTPVGTVPIDDAEPCDTVGPSSWITAGLVAVIVAVVALAALVDSTSVLQNPDERVSEALDRFNDIPVWRDAS